MSDDAVGSVDEQIAQMAERLIAMYDDELEWTKNRASATASLGA